jgi:exodeoxyribonuclease V gamma subunit
MLFIRFSNELDTLLEALSERSVAGHSSPFSTVDVFVPSTAMRRALQMATADRFGICANMRFSFLAQWLWRQVSKFTEAPADSPFSTEVLSWRIFTLFGDIGFVSRHPRLAGYLAKADPVMRAELAGRTAALYDQYMTYRPDWTKSWQEGASVTLAGAKDTHQEDQRWQMDLWKRLVSDIGINDQHLADVFFERLNAGITRPGRAGLPERVHVFCLPTMPPVYIDMLRRLARHIDVELYVLNPCREYWFEIVDRRRLSYLARQGQDAYHEVGNRLLAAWGKQTQAYIDLLLDDAGQATVEQSRFEPPGQASLLAHIQSAVLDLRDPAPGSIALAATDRSLEVHVCHTLTRELEVLHDQLLGMFASEHPPRASEILVVTPDLEGAAPLIDAVFGSAPAKRYIPYAITGRPGTEVNPVAKALLDLFAVAASRYQAGAVFALLQQPVIGQRFGVGADELETIRTWLVQSGIRWGIDADHRETFELPRDERHSFRDGLHRLFLGYALPASVARPFNTRIAACYPEGGDAAALGSFRHFFFKLEQLHRALAVALRPDAWVPALLAMLDDFIIADNDMADDLRDVQQAIAQLGTQMQSGGVSETVPASVVQHALKGLLGELTTGGTPTGAVTFASMSSLRNLPYRVICAIGMRDGAFPSPNRPPEFDLMALDVRRGDRQRRSEERNLFLDLLLAARERFYLSYTGKGVRDNATLPPSVLVSDLLDYVIPAVAEDPRCTKSMRAARSRIVIEHPLQAFSNTYFTGEGDRRLASFNEEYCNALKQRSGSTPSSTRHSYVHTGEDDGEETLRAPRPAFFAAALPDPEKEWHTVSFDQLVQFFRNPCRYLLRQRLGVGMADTVHEINNDEPLLPDFLGRSALADRLLPHLLKQASDAEIRALATAGLEYPPGPLGAHLLEQELQWLHQFAQGLMAKVSTDCLPPLSHSIEFEIDGAPWRLHGSIGDLRAHGLVRHRYDDTRAIDYLSAWLAHLFLNASGCKDATLETHWISRDGSFHLVPCDDARDCLEKLVRLYRQGLCAPLPFFPKSSWEYVKNGSETKEAEAIREARATWRSSIFRPHGEDRHEAYQLALRGIEDPLDDVFTSTANTVYGPMMQYLRDQRLK